MAQRLILIIETNDEMDRSDFEAFGDALKSDIERTTPGVMFAGNDASGNRVEWYVPKFTVNLSLTCRTCNELMPPADENPFNQICPNCAEPR